jgi:hypothetical protein
LRGICRPWIAVERRGVFSLSLSLALSIPFLITLADSPVIPFPPLDPLQGKGPLECLATVLALAGIVRTVKPREQRERVLHLGFPSLET